jgi:hypothetical protein
LHVAAFAGGDRAMGGAAPAGSDHQLKEIVESGKHAKWGQTMHCWAMDLQLDSMVSRSKEGNSRGLEFVQLTKQTYTR